MGTAQLTSAGTAVLKFRPGIGSHSYKAVFVGTYLGLRSSSSASALSVTATGKHPTTTAIARQGLEGDYTLTAAVAGYVNTLGLASPTGTVSFLDTSYGNVVLGTAELGTDAAGLGWTNPQSPATGYRPHSVAVGDFNGDGIPDLAVANESGTLTILLGNGDGTFTATAVSPATSGFSVAVGDFNGDGKADLAVANPGNYPYDIDGTVTILLGNGDGTFTAGASLATGHQPNSVAVGHFDYSGVADLAIANVGSNTVTILMGNGDGTFTAESSPTTGDEPNSVAVGDFNGDGAADLVVTNYNSPPTILLGNGDGTFTAAPSPAAAYPNNSVAVGDFNGDDIPDLALATVGEFPQCCTPGTVTILLGNGDGTFTAAAVSPTAGAFPYSVAVGDFNGDGNADLAVVNESSNTLTILLGNGDGTFTAAASPTTTSPATGFISPDFVAVGDFNGDGDADLAVANYYSYLDSSVFTVTVLLAELTQTATVTASGISLVDTGLHAVEASYPGDGSYSSSISGTIPLFGPPRSTTTTLAVTSAGAPTTSVAAGSVVTLTATVKVGAAAVTAGQVNFCDATAAHCTDIHLLGTEQLTSTGMAALKLRPGMGSHSYKAVFVGTGTDASSFSGGALLTVTTTGKRPTTTAIAYNGSEGDYTLTATVAGYVDTLGLASPTGTVSFLDTSKGNALLGTAALGLGEVALNWAESQTPGTDSQPSTVAVGDFNGDGKADVAVANYGGDTITVLLGNGDGTFTAASVNPATGYLPLSMAVGDFNGDGKADVAVANYGDNTVTVLLGNGDGTFTATSVSPATGNGPISMVVGDFNGDGKADLAVANYFDNTVTVLLGNGDGTFTATAVSPATGSRPNSIGVGDFNGDGYQDLAVANLGDGTVTVLLGNGDGTFTAAASPATGSGPTSIAVGDFNGDGRADLAIAIANDYSSTVTILLGNGDGTFTAAPAIPALFVGPQCVVVGDFNVDGKADLAVANYNSGNFGGMTILLGNGDGTFTATAVSPATGESPYSAAVGDFNGDGVPDLAVANGLISMVLLTELTQTTTAIASGISPVGPGLHQVDASYPGNGSYNSSVSGTVGLFGQPGPTTTTLAVTSSGAPVTAVASGTVVTLTATVKSGTTAVETGQVNFCDATAPHCTDIHLLGTAELTSAGSAQLRFVPGIGSHSYKAVFVATNTDQSSSSSASALTVTGSKFATETTIAKSGSAGNYTLKATVAGTGGTAAPTGTVSFLDTTNRNQVLGTAALEIGATGLSWTNSQSPATDISPNSVAVGDFNGDGRTDLAVANSGSNTVTILLGNGDGTFTATAVSPATGKLPVSVAVGDFNGDGKADLAVANQGSNTVTILLGNGDGTFTATAVSPATGYARVYSGGGFQRGRQSGLGRGEVGSR